MEGEKKMDAPRWINEKIVAEMTGLSCQTLRNQRYKGEGLPYSKIGVSVRYEVSDIIKYMENRKIIPRNER